MENIFLLTLLLVLSCQTGISSGELPNLKNETHGEDDNELERSVELSNLKNGTDEEDDEEHERDIKMPNMLNEDDKQLGMEDGMQLEREDDKQLPSLKDESNMMNQTQGPDDFQGQMSNKSTRYQGHSHTGEMYLDGGYTGGWGAGAYCPFPHFAKSMELKIESKQSGDDTALNAIALQCSNGQTITSAQSGWGYWRGAKYCKTGNYIKHAKIRKEGRQGWGDDTSANGVRFICTDNSEWHYPGDGYWGSYQSLQGCPWGSAVYGLQTQIESDQNGGDDTALNDVKLFCARIPACSGYSNQWSCCTPNSPCGVGQGDCDTDNDCWGSFICGSQGDYSNNCKSFNSWADSTADCCIRPRCSGLKSQQDCCTPNTPCAFGQGDCDTDSDCSGSLICGSKNCKNFDSAADSGTDCCINAPIHGGWSSWGSCSKSCRFGNSYGYQYRTCTNPKPQYGGSYCSGLYYRRCNENVCCPDNSGRMAQETAYPPNPTKSCPTLPEPTPCPTTTCPPIPDCPSTVTEPPTIPSCKPNKKCAEKNGKCFGEGEKVPEGAKKKGWCNKKMKCKCYEV